MAKARQNNIDLINAETAKRNGNYSEAGRCYDLVARAAKLPKEKKYYLNMAEIMREKEAGN